MSAEKVQRGVVPVVPNEVAPQQVIEFPAFLQVLCRVVPVVPNEAVPGAGGAGGADLGGTTLSH